jgi:hypothetical protein
MWIRSTLTRRVSGCSSACARPKRKRGWRGILLLATLERHAIPREFTTKSRVVIICNDWLTLNRNVAALQDRGHVLVFQPGAAEVHRKAGDWFKDQGIYSWFGDNLHRIVEPSFRYYVRAGELKAAGMHWTEVQALEAENKRARLAAELLTSDAHPRTKDKVRAFVQQGGGCKATFFNWRRRLNNGTVEKVAEGDG